MPLSLAAHHGWVTVAQLLIEEGGADMHIKDKHVRTPLWFAVDGDEESREVARLLIE